MSLVDGLSVGPPSTTAAPEVLEEQPQAGPGGHRDRGGAPAQPRRALGDLLVHVGDVLVLDRPDAVEQRLGGVRVVGVDVDAQRRLVADDQDRVAEVLEERLERAAVEPGADHGEVRAVAVARVGVVQARRSRRRVVRDLRQLDLLAGEAGDRAADDHRQAEGAGVDHPGVRQDVELLRRMAHGLAGRVQRGSQHRAEQGVLLGVARRPGRARAAPSARASSRPPPPSRARP